MHVCMCICIQLFTFRFVLTRTFQKALKPLCGQEAPFGLLHFEAPQLPEQVRDASEMAQARIPSQHASKDVLVAYTYIHVYMYIYI